MRFEILHASNADEALKWDTLFQQLPVERRDLHFTSAYARVQEHLGGKTMLAALSSQNFVIIQPFHLRTVPASASFDLCSLYGYGGPVSNIHPSAILDVALDRFRHELQSYCASLSVVAEFGRLHPLHATHQFSLLERNAIRAEKNVVIIPLTNFTTKTVSRRVRRALFKTQDTIAVTNMMPGPAEREDFAKLYAASMERKHASARWNVSREYLDAHFDELDARLFHASNGEGVRMLMVLGFGRNAYAHFLASNDLARHSGLDERLYYDAGQLLRADGYDLFHLGGGTTPDADDSLLAFKQGFGGAPFSTFTYQRVVDEQKYTALASAKACAEFREHGRESISGFFPIYRRDFT